MKKSAFTLIELLVVVSIIGILAALAIPAFQKVMERAHAAHDASNMKQIGLGIMGYTGDNDDTILTSGSWAAVLNPKYIPGWKVFQSPFDKRAGSENGVTSPASPLSYDVNINLSGSSMSTVISPSVCILLAASMSVPSTQTFALTAASSTLGKLSKAGNPSTATYPGGTYSSGKYINVLFADSHVGAMLMTDFHNTTNQITNSDPSATIQNLRWNQAAQ